MSDRSPQAETDRKRQLLAELTGRTEWSAKAIPLKRLVHRAKRLVADPNA